jgi:hypothetical protein
VLLERAPRERFVLGGAEQDADLARLAGGELEHELQRAAGVEAGAGGARERRAGAQRRGAAGRAVPAEELAPAAV